MTYFLTQIQLTPEIIVKEKITDTYSIHRLVYDQFSKDYTDSSASRKNPLWTVSVSGVFNKVVILSSEFPRNDVSPYVKNNRAVITYPEKILSSSKHYIFKITANPSLKKDGKIRPIRDREYVKQWFSKVGEKNGFYVDCVVVSDIHADIFSYKDRNKVTINKAEISGELQVHDPYKFKFAVLNGIGREKSFGCGLLQVIPKE